MFPDSDLNDNYFSIPSRAAELRFPKWSGCLPPPEYFVRLISLRLFLFELASLTLVCEIFLFELEATSMPLLGTTMLPPPKSDATSAVYFFSTNVLTRMSCMGSVGEVC
jgi:hypothetical protein